MTTFADNIKQHGLEDRVQRKGIDTCPYITPSTRERWEAGWRYADARLKANQHLAEMERERRLNRQPFYAVVKPAKVKASKGKRSPADDW